MKQFTMNEQEVRLPWKCTEEGTAPEPDCNEGVRNPLVALLHRQMRSAKVTELLSLEHDTFDVTCEFYPSRSEAEEAAHREINRAYDQASHYFVPEHRTCVARSVARRYSNHLKDRVEETLEGLRAYCVRSRHLEELLLELEDKVCHAEERLLEMYERELSSSEKYYRMYQRGYFLDSVEIEAHDYNVDLFDFDLFNLLARLIHDETEYTVSRLPEIIGEMEEDVRRRGDTFFTCAHLDYRAYCAEIEKIAEEIGKDLSGDDLAALGIGAGLERE